MRPALLYPEFRHPAIEERYGRWQAQLFLRRVAAWEEEIPYFDTETLDDVVEKVDAEFCVVVTDPLLLVAPTLLDSLEPALTAGVVAALPVTNEPAIELQRAAAGEGYLTIRQFEETAAALAATTGTPRLATWVGDPGLFLCRTEFLRRCKRVASEALDDEQVAIAPAAYVHRWTQLRAQNREDLLPRIPTTARNILEFGCAEGLLGQEIKRRQKCRFVGIEIDEHAADAARKRLDDVYRGDATTLISIIHDRFDCIIGGDVLEHLEDPWSFLADLRRVAAPGALLILSVPNIANWAIVSDLLQNRFDYAYIAITCAGHLRFFSRHTIADALAIAGWSVASIEPQTALVTGEGTQFIARLAAAGFVPPENDLLAPGFYVLARNGE